MTRKRRTYRGENAKGDKKNVSIKIKGRRRRAKRGEKNEKGRGKEDKNVVRNVAKQ